MQITKINNSPYSQKLEEEIMQAKRGIYFEKEHLACEAQSYDALDDRVTIRFDSTDDPSKITLPFQTNVTWVDNITDYKASPRWNFIKNFIYGRLEGVQTQELAKFLQSLKTREVATLVLLQRRGHEVSPNHNIPNDRGHKYWVSTIYQPEDDTLDLKLLSIENEFSRFPVAFYIDPTSELRVEQRRKGDGSLHIKASLGTLIWRGISSAPPITQRFIQTIEVKIK